jgi:hypothetical protein
VRFARKRISRRQHTLRLPRQGGTESSGATCVAVGAGVVWRSCPTCRVCSRELALPGDDRRG